MEFIKSLFARVFHNYKSTLDGVVWLLAFVLVGIGTNLAELVQSGDLKAFSWGGLLLIAGKALKKAYDTDPYPEA